MNNTNNNTNNTERQNVSRPVQSSAAQNGAPRTSQGSVQRPVQRTAQGAVQGSAQRSSQSTAQRPTRPVGTQTQSSERSTAAQQNPVRRPEGYSQQPRPTRPSSATSGSRLTVEERRRIEAARLAAMNSVKRMSDDEEYRLRKMEQDFLEAEQPKISRPAQQRPSAQPREDRSSSASSYRKKKRVKINWGAIILVLIIAAVVGVSAWQITKNPAVYNPGEKETGDVIDNGGSETEDLTGELNSGTDETETDPPEEEVPLVLYETKIQLNKYIDVGNQILVNNNHAYARVDDVELTYVRANRQSDIQVSATLDSLTQEAFEALDKMTADLRALGCEDWLLLTSGYRNTEEQQSIWDRNVTQSGLEYTQRYVAIPGHSEHHTGLACDLSFFTYSYATIPVADHEFGPWLWDNCSNYGFILRYTKDMEETTGIAYEPWHFRYIGFPHAKAVEHFDLCYEDYVEVLKKYTFETRLLYVKSDGTVASADPEEMPTSDGYLIYYVPMEEGESTQIKVPSAFEYEKLEISGNNVDGFIVTIHLFSAEN